jgi:SAM-dependent methyltransferase
MRPAEAIGDPAAAYWDAVLHRWEGVHRDSLWRRHSDAVNGALLTRWLPSGPHRVLKTDMFDEAVSDGLYPLLRDLGATVTGIDVSPEVVAAARARYPGLGAIAADVLKLPFPDGAFDAIVSLSTLDHFASRLDISTALGELRRVLAGDGTLVLTIDNAANPVVRLRNCLPSRVLQRTGLVPYDVGVTCGPRDLDALLSAAGFRALERSYILHCPRVLSVAAARVVQRAGSPAAGWRYLALLRRFERLSGLPTSVRTGYFIAVRAVKA